jgi:hypothetical protein
MLRKRKRKKCLLNYEYNVRRNDPHTLPLGGDMKEVVPYRLRANNFYCLLNCPAVTIDLGQPFPQLRVMNIHRGAGKFTGTFWHLSSPAETQS